MLKKIWRYSHFILTVSSSLFLLLASVTGAFLAFKPIQEKLLPFKTVAAENMVLSQLIDTLTTQYQEVLDIEVDKNYFVKASVFSLNDDLNGKFYLDPVSGKKIADIPKENAFFDFLTDFHRSLFFKTPGRIFVGVTSFLLCLISVTGLLLAINRQGGLVKLCSKIINDKSVQYNHVALGRVLLIPIFIVAITGTFLSLDRFSLLPNKVAVVSNEFVESTPISFADFEVFKNTKLKDFTKLEFPFSTDPEDYFVLSLKDRTYQIHQKTGQIIEETKFPFTQVVSVLSFNLHTGTGNITWSLVLFICSLGILYFMYSGVVISIQRLQGRTKNKWKASEARIVILIGSENGSTKRLGKMLYVALLKANKKVFLDDLNNYQSYNNIEQLLILTATYGNGEPPSNANLFLERLQKTKIDSNFECHVLGFGSYAYPHFCAFAKKTHSVISLQSNIDVKEKYPVLIHNQDYKQFKEWTLNWAKKYKFEIELPASETSKKIKEINFKLKAKEVVKDAYDEIFTLTLTSNNKKFLPGDLLRVFPPEETVERLYSIGQNSEGELLLSVKKHEFGICSNYLYSLELGTTLKATIQQNQAFHLPKKKKQIFLIANGTGIAPFLGMIHQKTKASLRLYWGTRTKKSFNLYKNSIEQGYQNGNLNKYVVAFSKEESEFTYVQDCLFRDEKEVIDALRNGDVFMLCGSLVMRDSVFELLDELCSLHQLHPFEYYKNKGQVLTDCY